MPTEVIATVQQLAKAKKCKRIISTDNDGNIININNPEHESIEIRRVTEQEIQNYDKENTHNTQ